MGMNDTPSSERLHIGFFGRRNAGKSSLVNAVTGQELSVVSDVKGTTTDPVKKTMELLPLGPVVIIDTPGFDDEGMLGEMRVRKTRQVLNRIDIAILVVDATQGVQDCEQELLAMIREKAVPYLIVMNKCDLLESVPVAEPSQIYVSAADKTNIYELKERIGALQRSDADRVKLVGDLIGADQLIVLVVPIDKAAPKGRLILPQQMAIRDILDADACVVCVKENQLESFLNQSSIRPSLVITDSQVFEQVSAVVPRDIPLTSFSILMARYKGFLETAVHGANAIANLKDGDRVLISEGCTHHRQCNDIGTVKMPGWLKEYTGAELIIETSSGQEFPEDLSDYALVVHCGGCMLTEREMRYRMKCAMDQKIPFTNYGTAIAFMKGILKRSLEIIPRL